MPFPERLLWSRLRRKQVGVRFLRQQPIGPYIVDFFCPPANLIIEVDGRSHDGRFAYDQRRQAELTRRGYTVVRFSNDEIIADVDAVASQIESLLRED